MCFENSLYCVYNLERIMKASENLEPNKQCEIQKKTILLKKLIETHMTMSLRNTLLADV